MIGIVTVQWNSSELTIKFLESLSTHLSDNVTLVIIDNGSDKVHIDRLKEELAENFSEHLQADNIRITLIENQENSGFARANNIGISYFLEQNKAWIWLLNNDCLITDNSINQAIVKLTDLPPSIQGTRILDNLNDLETFGGYIFNKWTSTYQPIKQSDSKIIQHPLFYVSGASMLIHRELFKKCGLLDESTFLYFEEIDFCQRAKKAGYTIGLLSEVIVSHLGSGSSDKPALKNTKTYHETWSTLYFYRKHQQLLFPFVLVFRSIIKIILLILKSRRHEITSVISATKDFLLARNKDLSPVKIIKTTHYK